MPVSLWLGIEDCLEVVTRQRPGSVLDAGIGFGLWGHLLRQYLDVWEGRIQPDEWQTRIDGVEIAEERVQAHARYLYDEIVIGDIREVVPQRARAHVYDVILFGDVLEHLRKPDATRLLREATALAAALVLVRIPLGDGWRREGREVPDHHRSRWRLDDFADFACEIRQYHYVGNPYAFVAIDAPLSRSCALYRAEHRLEILEERIAQLLGAGSEKSPA